MIEGRETTPSRKRCNRDLRKASRVYLIRAVLMNPISRGKDHEEDNAHVKVSGMGPFCGCK